MILRFLPTRVVSLANTWIFPWPFVSFRCASSVFWWALLKYLRISFSPINCWAKLRYGICAYWAIRFWYSELMWCTSFLPRASLPPILSQAITALATNRLMSHSQLPGRVSSKSLIPKTKRCSAVPNNPKLETCISPHNWTVISVVAWLARSCAMMAAPPR